MVFGTDVDRHHIIILIIVMHSASQIFSFETSLEGHAQVSNVKCHIHMLWKLK